MVDTNSSAMDRFLEDLREQAPRLWVRDKLAGFKIRKVDMNRLVMDFLETEGYLESVKIFRTESGTDPYTLVFFTPSIRYAASMNLEATAARMEAKRAVLSGDTHRAIQHLDGTNVEERFLTEIKMVTSLLTFEGPNESPFSDHLHSPQREKIANEVNIVILKSQGHGEDSLLVDLLRRLERAQDELDKQAFYCRLFVNCSLGTLVWRVNFPHERA